MSGRPEPMVVGAADARRLLAGPMHCASPRADEEVVADVRAGEEVVADVRRASRPA
ncbi:hypothetical protein ACU635_05045 [[Actinomadura] parvosata]|uniref:hypothetical protein n=1 Tax=[Actinomadura] parvosata TaxID=1955412 RepID=UPI00406C2AEC